LVLLLLVVLCLVYVLVHVSFPARVLHAVLLLLWV